ncbi:uncharacterized protein LOC128224938 [Mya arenaria]|uniref:uncharacterized protein LOC128224938 n=1 Tax=Mya arenaria TaxID=6604 RepID=UPI0022DEBAC3|nr:uncharacterized protein LOC128224938 [Mya arenaria]XP_052791004.1 uncharacterized protein LOC128224938 [Mya arenaria]XP_052791005.1 uncharacterized protein LOC128224938 [Mya arenaria]XP_052791006.1 uncharacterized protein LOC128224938 [Mya arenaria]XP_052791007.1 uncharacterized protein LOC128224938 [Mya arenaria]XP_052791008.1 uncharacterized protein LOC128224938 [Mya arenaria]
MDTGRVGACHRLENKRRKFLMVINDVVKNKYDVYAEYLDHAHTEADYNFEKSKMFVRRALVRQKVLQKCMKMRRREAQPRSVFGRYGGKPVESFSRDIEGFIAHNHPKLRRKRHLERLLNESLDKGAILKQTTVKNRMSGWMERSYTKYKLLQQKREQTNLEKIEEELEKATARKPQGISRLPVLTNPFYSGARNDPEPEDNENPEAEIAKTKPEAEMEVNVLNLAKDFGNVNLKSKVDTSVVNTNKTLEQRRSLVLPPISPTKAMMSAVQS